MKKVLVLMVMALGIPAMAASSLLDKMNEVNAKIDATQARTTQKIQAKQDEAKAQREAREAQKAAFQKKIEAQKAADKARQEELKKQLNF